MEKTFWINPFRIDVLENEKFGVKSSCVLFHCELDEFAQPDDLWSYLAPELN